MDDIQRPLNPAGPPTPSPAPASQPPTTPSPLGIPGTSFNAPTPKPSRKKWPILLVTGVLILAAGGAALYYFLQKDTKPATSTQQTVKIGVLLPYSGPASAGGLGVLKGVQLAKKQLNASNIELVQIDSKCDGPSAETAMKEAVNKGVVGVIGEGCSGASLKMLPIANENKVPMVSPLSSNPSLSIKDDYFFRVVPSDEYQGAFTANHFKNKGIKTVSVIKTNELYGNGLAKVFKTEFEKLGGKVVSESAIEPDNIKPESQIATAKAAKPEALYIVSNSVPSSIAVIKLMRSAGVNAPVYGADTLNVNAVLTEGGAAAEGLTVNTFSGGTKTFKQALANEYPSEEFLFGAAEGYDAFNAFYKVISGGATTGEQVKEGLKKVDFEGVSGRIKFNENGEVTDKEHKYDILIAKDGAFVSAE